MTRAAKDIALAHHIATRDFCKALDSGRAFVTGAPSASVRAGGSAPLAALMSQLGPKYGLTPVPADMLALGIQANPMQARAAASHAFAASRLSNIVPISLQAQTPAVNAAVQKLINDIQTFISQVQNNPSDQQLLQSGLHFIADIANVYATASTSDQATLDALKNRLINLGIQTAASTTVTLITQAASSGSDGSDPGY